MKCLGSTQLIARSPRSRRTSDFAREGTAAHAVAQKALDGEQRPEEWVDRRIVIDDRTGESWLVDEEMKLRVEDYLYEVNARWRPGVKRFVEHKLTLAHADPSDILFAQCAGTADVVHVDEERGIITVIDLKYGKGVMVAGNSPQLKLYSLMAMLAFAGSAPWKSVQTVVVQPRALMETERVKEFTFEPSALTMDFLGEVAEAMERSLEPDPPLVPGDHCRWCEAKTNCPALQEQALTIAEKSGPAASAKRLSSMLGPIPKTVVVGTDVDLAPAIQPGTLTLPSAGVFSPEQIGNILKSRPLLNMWLEGMEHRAVQLLEAGIHVPGFALKQRVGNRKFIDEKDAQVKLLAAGVQISQMYTEPKLKSPAQIEKIMPKKNIGVLKSIVERPLGEVSLVADTASDVVSTAPLLGPIADT